MGSVMDLSLWEFGKAVLGRLDGGEVGADDVGFRVFVGWMVECRVRDLVE